MSLHRNFLRRLGFPGCLAAIALVASCDNNHRGTTHRDTAPVQSSKFAIVGAHWQASGLNPNPALGLCPSWTCLGIADPWIGNGPNGRLLFFTAAGDQNTQPYPIIGRAEVAQDLTVTLAPDEPIIREGNAGDWDQAIETVSLRWNDEVQRWDMYYLGWSGTSYFDDPKIGHLRSLDAEGLLWSRGNPPIYSPDPAGWDNGLISGPDIMRGPDGIFRLYFMGAADDLSRQGIGLLVSPDGETWTAHPANPVFERDLTGWDQGVGEPSVRYLHGQYVMWYSGWREPLPITETIAIGVAYSWDGVSWERYAGNPVIEPGVRGTWNDKTILSPSVLEASDGTLWMSAYGTDSRGTHFGVPGWWKAIP